MDERTTVNDEAKMSVSESDIAYVPVTLARYEQVEGPFFHGTKSALEVGDRLVPGQDRKSVV